MPVFLERVKFTVDNKSWGNEKKFELKGTIEVGVGAKLGEVLGVEVMAFEEMTFALNKLPIEIQDKLINIHNDIQEHLSETHKMI